MEWTDFNDREPDAKKTGDYLVIDENGAKFIAYWHNGRMNYPSGESFYGSMTHWMPLPESPKPKGPFKVCCIFDVSEKEYSYQLYFAGVSHGPSVKDEQVAYDLRLWLNQLWANHKP